MAEQVLTDPDTGVADKEERASWPGRGWIFWKPSKKFILFADLPGVRPNDVDVRFENGELTIHGRRTPPHAGKRTGLVGIRAGALPPGVPSQRRRGRGQDRCGVEERRPESAAAESRGRQTKADRGERSNESSRRGPLDPSGPTSDRSCRQLLFASQIDLLHSLASVGESPCKTARRRRDSPRLA